MELSTAIELDCDVEMTDDSNSVLGHHFARPDVRQSTLPPGQGHGRTGGRVKDGRPPPRTSHDLETVKDSDLRVEFMDGTDYLDSKPSQFGTGGRTTMEETHSSPTVKLAGQTLQRQSSEDAAPMDSSTNPAFVPDVASTQDLADRNYGLEQSPSDCHTLGLGNAHSNTSEDAFSTAAAHRWGIGDTGPRLDRQREEFSTVGARTQCFDDKRRDMQTDDFGTRVHMQNVSDVRHPTLSSAHGSLKRDSGFYLKYDVVGKEGFEGRQLGHANVVDQHALAVANQASAGTVLPTPDKRYDFQDTPILGLLRSEGQGLGEVASQRSHVDGGYANLDREIHIQCAIERVARELNFLQDELSSVSSHSTICDPSDETLPLQSTPVYGPNVNPDGVIQSGMQNVSPPKVPANSAQSSRCKADVNKPPVGYRHWSSTSSDDSSTPPQRRARSLEVRPTQPTFPLGDPPAVCRANLPGLTLTLTLTLTQMQYAQSTRNDRVDVATSPLVLSPSQSRYFTVHKCHTGVLSEHGFPPNPVTSVPQVTPVSDVSRGSSSDATRQWYGSTGAWVQDVNSRARSDVPQNGRIWAATTQGHNGTWVSGDVNVSNTREDGESRCQIDHQSRDAGNKSSINKMSVHDDAKAQSNRTRDSSQSRGEDTGRRAGRKPAGDDPSSSGGGEDEDRHSKRPQGRGRGKRGSPLDPGGELSASKSGQFRRGPHFMKPEKLSGNDSFESFIMGFENAAKYNGWDEVDRRAWFRASITGPAATILWGMD